MFVLWRRPKSGSHAWQNTAASRQSEEDSTARLPSRPGIGLVVVIRTPSVYQDWRHGIYGYEPVEQALFTVSTGITTTDNVTTRH